MVSATRGLGQIYPSAKGQAHDAIARGAAGERQTRFNLSTCRQCRYNEAIATSKSPREDAMTVAEAIALAAAIGMLLFFVAVFVSIALTFRPWFQAVLSSVPISVFQIIGMRLRRTNVNVVVRNLIIAKQAGVSLSSIELERAYLQGCDLEKLVLAMIEAKKRGQDIKFQEAVDADLHGRLQEELKAKAAAGTVRS